MAFGGTLSSPDVRAAREVSPLYARGSRTYDALRPKAGELLTKSEQRVELLASQGKRNKDIAAEMGITEGTVKTYLNRVFIKHNLSARGELQYRANRHHLQDWLSRWGKFLPVEAIHDLIGSDESGEKTRWLA